MLKILKNIVKIIICRLCYKVEYIGGENIEKNKKKFKETIDELQALATFLENFVTEISQKDEEIKTKINAVD